MAAIDISDFISTKANDFYIQSLLPLKEYFSNTQRAQLVSLIESIPECKTLLHSDAQAKNILVQNGELLLIDMDDIMIGHPIYDLADISFMYDFITRRDNGPEITGLSKELCHDFNEKILALCLQDLDEQQKEIVKKALEMVGRIRVTGGTIPYLFWLDEKEASKKTADLVQDLIDQVLPCQKELEQALALFSN